MADSLRVAVLGPVRVVGADGNLVDVPGVNGKSLIVALVLARGRVVSAPALVDDIWQDDPPRNGKAALQTLVSRVRDVAGDGLIESVAGGYRLTADATQVDLWREDAPRRGEPGADLGDSELAVRLRETADGLRAERLEHRAGAALEAGDAAAALAAAEELAASTPFDEHAQLLLMRALGASGRRGDALRSFAEFKERLADELGIDPGPALVACNAELLRVEGVPGSRPAEAAAERPGRFVVGVRAAPNALIGRDSDIRELERMIAGSRLTTVLGPGGLGKTRLAQELAGRAVLTTPAVVVVELASIRDPDDVPLAVASALGIGEAAGGRLSLADPIVLLDLRTRIVAALEERRTLLVLDNCEHVVEQTAYLVDEILSAVPSVRVLATSRSPLQLSAESVYPLRSLTEKPAGVDAARAPSTDEDVVLSPAVELFIERARAARPGAALPPDAVTRLVERLDGLPLAIELAAARIRSMSVDEIERRLGNRFSLLKGGDRGAPERHRTLLAVIDWSWNLLSDGERRLLRRLSRFPDGFSAEAAVFAAGADGDEEAAEMASDDLDALVLQSLASVREHAPSGTLRYRMLETVREFGDMALSDAGEDEAAARAMARWARAFTIQSLTEFGSGEQAASTLRLALEHDNLTAILRSALDAEDTDTAIPVFGALLFFWLIRNQFQEALAFGVPMAALGVTAELPEDALDASAVMLMFSTVLGVGRMARGDFGNAERLEGVSGEPAPSPSDSIRAGLRAGIRLRGLLHADAPLSPWLCAMAQLMVAASRRERMESELARLRTSDDPAEALIANLLSGLLLENRGDTEAALRYSRAAYDTAAASGSTWTVAQSAQSLVQLASQADHPAEALEWAEHARSAMLAMGATEDMRQLEWLLTLNRLKLGQTEGAREVFQFYLDEEPEQPGFGPFDLQAVGWAGLAEVAAAEGRPEECVTLYLRGSAGLVESARSGLQGVWYQIAAAGALSACAFNGAIERPGVTELAHALRLVARVGLRLRDTPDSGDRPVLGTALAGLSAWLLADRADATPEQQEAGLRMLALAEALHSRQDQPMLRHALHEEQATARVGAAALAEAKAWAAGVGGLEKLVEAAVELLRITRI